MPQDTKHSEQLATDDPKPAEPRATDAPKPPQTPALDITDEDWIAASQGCCGRKE